MPWRDGLCAADLIDLIHTGDMCGTNVPGLTFPSAPGGVVMMIRPRPQPLPEARSSVRWRDTAPFPLAHKRRQSRWAESSCRGSSRPVLGQTSCFSAAFRGMYGYLPHFFHNLHKVCIHLLICLVDFFPGYADVGCIHFAVVKLLCIGKRAPRRRLFFTVSIISATALSYCP